MSMSQFRDALALPVSGDSSGPIRADRGAAGHWWSWLDRGTDDGVGKLPTGVARSEGERAMDAGELPRQALIDLLPEAYVLMDVGTRCFVLANAAAETLLGYSQDELLRMTPADVCEPADGSRLALAFETLMPGTVSRREWVVRTRLGRLVLVGVTSVPIVLNGRLLIQMIVHDLSEEDPAAAQRTLLALANDRLAVSLDYEETLRAVLALIVPRIADRCTIELADQAGRLCCAARATVDAGADDGVAVTVAPLDGNEPTVGLLSGAGASATLETNEANGQVATFALRAHGRDLGVLTLERLAPRVWQPEARSLAVALARRVAQAIDSALLWQTAQRELARRAAILRISRAFAESEPGSDRAMQVLLDEAHGDAGGRSRRDLALGRGARRVDAGVR